MILAAVSVLVVIAASDPGDGSTRAIEQALRAALVRDATIVVRPLDKDTSETSAVAMGTAEHASLVGVVSWSDHQRRVSVRFVKLPEGRWTDREVRFDAADAPTERGRTVGFALASMMPDEAFAEHPEPPPPRQAEPTRAGPLVNAGPVTSPEQRAPVPAELPRPNPLALDATAIAATAPAGYGGGIGGQFALRVPLLGAVGARVALAARAEAIGPAAASFRTLAGAAGIVWQPWLDSRHKWAAGLRADALVLWLDVAHLDEDDRQAAHLSRFVGGFDAAAEGTYRFGDRAALVAAFGTEVSLGTTGIVVKDRQVASLTPTKLLAELGIRVSFQ